MRNVGETKPPYAKKKTSAPCIIKNFLRSLIPY